MEQATVYRWNIRNGTGVLSRPDGSLAWFHLSSVAQPDVLTLQDRYLRPSIERHTAGR